MPKKTVPWHLVPDADFAALTDTDLAARLGCTPQNVAHHRRQRGLAAHKRGGDRSGPAPEKPPFRLSRAAAAHLRALARAAGVNPSAFLLSLPDPPAPPAAPASGSGAGESSQFPDTLEKSGGPKTVSAAPENPLPAPLCPRCGRP